MRDSMSRPIRKSLILIVLLAAQSLYAQEQSGADNSDTQEQTDPETADGKKPSTTRSAQPQKDKGRDGEIFRPSEEISEDFAVSFPVDI